MSSNSESDGYCYIVVENNAQLPPLPEACSDTKRGHIGDEKSHTEPEPKPEPEPGKRVEPQGLESQPSHISGHLKQRLSMQRSRSDPFPLYQPRRVDHSSIQHEADLCKPLKRCVSETTQSPPIQISRHSLTNRGFLNTYRSLTNRGFWDTCFYELGILGIWVLVSFGIGRFSVAPASPR